MKNEFNSRENIAYGILQCISCIAPNIKPKVTKGVIFYLNLNSNTISTYYFIHVSFNSKDNSHDIARIRALLVASDAERMLFLISITAKPSLLALAGCPVRSTC